MDFDFSGVEIPQVVDSTHVLGRRLTDSGGRSAELGGLDSTLNIIWNDLKYKAQVVKTFGDIPLIECIPSELNQVFMNILLNAGQAIKDRGIVTVSTSLDGDHVVIAIGDDGIGIPGDLLPKIFDPFFTTKPVGTGTGLGLAISYGLIKKHHGTIDVTSTPGEGTLFLIRLPVQQPGKREV